MHLRRLFEQKSFLLKDRKFGIKNIRQAILLVHTLSYYIYCGNETQNSTTPVSQQDKGENFTWKNIKETLDKVINANEKVIENANMVRSSFESLLKLKEKFDESELVNIKKTGNDLIQIAIKETKNAKNSLKYRQTAKNQPSFDVHVYNSAKIYSIYIAIHGNVIDRSLLHISLHEEMRLKKQKANKSDIFRLSEDLLTSFSDLGNETNDQSRVDRLISKVIIMKEEGIKNDDPQSVAIANKILAQNEILLNHRKTYTDQIEPQITNIMKNCYKIIKKFIDEVSEGHVDSFTDEDPEIYDHLKKQFCIVRGFCYINLFFPELCNPIKEKIIWNIIETCVSYINICAKRPFKKEKEFRKEIKENILKIFLTFDDFFSVANHMCNRLELLRLIPGFNVEFEISEDKLSKLTSREHKIFLCEIEKKLNDIYKYKQIDYFYIEVEKLKKMNEELKRNYMMLEAIFNPKTKVKRGTKKDTKSIEKTENDKNYILIICVVVFVIIGGGGITIYLFKFKKSK